METAVDHATDQPLTEGANAHGIGEGKYRRCNPTPVHIGPMGDGWGKCQHMVGCPLGHRCHLNTLIDRYERVERLLSEAMARDCPDVDDIDYLTERAERTRLALDTQYEPHVALWARHDAQRAHSRNREKLHKGAWAFTLTYSPVKHGWSKDEAQAVMSEAIRRLRHYYRNELVEFDAIGEYTQAGLPHVHGHYRLNGGLRMTTKNFKRAYPIWNPKVRIGKGHEGGYHEPASRDSDYSGYIQKDLDESWLVVSTTRDVDRTQEANLPEASDDEAQASVSSSRSTSDAEPSHR